jgi:hypothetical protein
MGPQLRLGLGLQLAGGPCSGYGGKGECTSILGLVPLERGGVGGERSCAQGGSQEEGGGGRGGGRVGGELVALVSLSFRRPNEFFRLHLPTRQWYHLEGAACRHRYGSLMVPAGRRVLVLGGVECKGDSSASDEVAVGIFVLGAKVVWPRDRAERQSKYPQHAVLQAASDWPDQVQAAEGGAPLIYMQYVLE